MFVALKNKADIELARQLAQQCCFPEPGFIDGLLEQLKNASLPLVLATPAEQAAWIKTGLPGMPARPTDTVAQHMPLQGSGNDLADKADSAVATDSTDMTGPTGPIATADGAGSENRAEPGSSDSAPASGPACAANAPNAPNAPITPIAPAQWLLAVLNQHGLLKITSAAHNPALTLIPDGPTFHLFLPPDVSAPIWKMSRFGYLHHIAGGMAAHHPNSLCHVQLHESALLALLFQLNAATGKSAMRLPKALLAQHDAIFRMLAWSGMITPCCENQIGAEDQHPVLQQWEFHDLLFHAQTRLGRNPAPQGATFRFRDVLPEPAAIELHGWTREVLNLPHPNLQDLFFRDMPLTAAIESRHSTRRHSALPLTVEQLGHFLYRTVRNRQILPQEAGPPGVASKPENTTPSDAVTRPYPSNGAAYEQEFYVAVNGCIGVRRGLYYYDPQQHHLCLICEPTPVFEGLLDDASAACDGQCRPQILLVLANRFARSHWKYGGISYSSQLKNIGAIYQTMYLVATAMNIAACALNIGNSERFARLTGLDYLAQGSIGEFILGRPLL